MMSCSGHESMPKVEDYKVTEDTRSCHFGCLVVVWSSKGANVLSIYGSSSTFGVADVDNHSFSVVLTKDAHVH